MKPRCAICIDGSGRAENGGTEATTRLCARCRSDPANADWVDAHDREDLSDTLDTHAAPLRLADLIQTPLSPVEERNQRIVALLLRGSVPKIRSVRVRFGTVLAWVPVELMRPPSLRDVARIVVVSKDRVWRLWRRIRAA